MADFDFANKIDAEKMIVAEGSVEASMNLTDEDARTLLQRVSKELPKEMIQGNTELDCAFVEFERGRFPELTICVFRLDERYAYDIPLTVSEAKSLRKDMERACEEYGTPFAKLENEAILTVCKKIDFLGAINANDEILWENGCVNASLFLYDSEYDEILRRAGFYDENGIKYEELVEDDNTTLNVYADFKPEPEMVLSVVGDTHSKTYNIPLLKEEQRDLLKLYNEILIHATSPLSEYGYDHGDEVTATVYKNGEIEVSVDSLIEGTTYVNLSDDEMNQIKDIIGFDSYMDEIQSYEKYKAEWIKDHIDDETMKSTLQKMAEVNLELCRGDWAGRGDWDERPYKTIDDFVRNYGFANRQCYAGYYEWRDNENNEKEEALNDIKRKSSFV